MARSLVASVSLISGGQRNIKTMVLSVSDVKFNRTIVMHGQHVDQTREMRPCFCDLNGIRIVPEIVMKYRRQNSCMDPHNPPLVRSA